MKLTLASLLFALVTMPASAPAADAQNNVEIKAAAQKICPVSGIKLGDHGKPVERLVGSQKVLVCCKGCVKAKVKPKHWATVVANMRKSQAKCPVMNKPLPKTAKGYVVKGELVFVCCPPCVKKLAGDSAKYLKKVQALHAASAKASK